MDRFGGMPIRLPWGYLKKYWRGYESGAKKFDTGKNMKSPGMEITIIR